MSCRQLGGWNTTGSTDAARIYDIFGQYDFLDETTCVTSSLDGLELHGLLHGNDVEVTCHPGGVVYFTDRASLVTKICALTVGQSQHLRENQINEFHQVSLPLESNGEGSGWCLQTFCDDHFFICAFSDGIRVFCFDENVSLLGERLCYRTKRSVSQAASRGALGTSSEIH